MASTSNNQQQPLNGSVSSNGILGSKGNTELPKSFISAMRKLFDIMADEVTGYVRFADIEQRWQEGSAGLPRGVIDSLRKFLTNNNATYTLTQISTILCTLSNTNQTYLFALLNQHLVSLCVPLNIINSEQTTIKI